MANQYSQRTAMWAITKASLRGIFKSPQAIFFSLFFPIVLIMVFGALGGGGISMDVGFDPQSDTANVIYQVIKHNPIFDIAKGTPAELEDKLKKGRITALIQISRGDFDSTNRGSYDIHLRTTAASQREMRILEPVLQKIIGDANRAANPVKTEYATISVEEVKGRPYRNIDFYLPGMIGFSLIGSAIFSVAFVFFSLRETLVLKRMFSTPIKKGYIVLGESIARVAFQLATVVVLILFGKFFYNFTLANGWITFVELLALSFFGLTVFMGFGFIISSIAKNQNVIPVYANLIMFPQYFLSGTFFPKSLLPVGMQKVITYLPLTALNDAMRKISFEGLHIWQVGKEIAILTAWAIIGYAILVRVFRWE
jgi:ABC-2 type transport system permease protein